jgi:predicted porin
MPQRPLTATAAVLAIACLPAASFAQSSVALSGFIDIGVYRGFDKSKNVGTIQRSSLTLAGAEELGDGLSATFKLQHRFDADTGTSEGAGSKPFWHGESTVGLKGAFGHVRLGRALDVVYANDWAFDPWYNFDRIASPAWNNWHWNYATDRTANNGSPEYGRLSNGVFYDSPSLRGFTVHFSGAFENSTVAGAGTGDNAGVAIQYGQGPLALMLAGSRNSSGDTVQFLGAKYRFDALTVMGVYDRSVFNAATDSTAKVVTLGASYAIGRGNLKAGFGHRDVDGTKSRFVGLGADYGLSKRTTVYVSLGHQNPDGAASRSAYGAGISHSF